ncbi:Protein NRT1/ PTR FAMILY 5.4 [Linum perenne]
MDSTVAPVETGRHGQKKNTKERTKGGWNAALFIIFVEMAERFAFYGLTGNLISYLTKHLHQQTVTAVKNINTWVGVSCLFPIVGAVVADSYLGRFTTILLASLIYFIGMVLLTLSVSVVPMSHREAVFFTALYVMAVGEGGHKPCVQTFAADQFDEDNPEEKAAKSSFFNWWYLGIVFGSSAAVLVVIYIQDNVGWTAGLGILAGAMAAALVVFLIGIRTYRKQAPIGSPYTQVAQVVVAALRKRRVDVGRGECSMCYYEDDDEGPAAAASNDHHVHGIIKNNPPMGRTNQFRFLDKAAMIIDNVDSSIRRDPWRLCTVNQVEEVKLLIRLIPIWISCLMFTVVLTQNHTFYVKQAATLNTRLSKHFTIPPASLQSIIGITILITVPLYDRVFVPFARRLTGHPSGITVLQRIGFGLFLSIVEASVAALVESRRLRVVQTTTMSVWWLLPQYVVSGMSDAFTVVGLQELFYEQMPVSMRSMGAAAFTTLLGIGSFMNTGVMMVVEEASGGKWMKGDDLNRISLDKYYWVLAGLSLLNLCVYLLVAKRFVYKRVVEDGRGRDDDDEVGDELGFIGGKVDYSSKG